MQDSQTASIAQHSPLAHTNEFTGSQSTSGTATTVNSPTVEAVTRHELQVPKTIVKPRVTFKSSQKKFPSTAPRPVQSRPTVFPGSAIRGRLPIPSGDEHPGRFEREFVEIDELGHGEFGRVIKARYKKDSSVVFAVKKCKPFEGVKHRYATSICTSSAPLLICRSPSQRLREEVDTLKHLSDVARASGFGNHPNVMGYLDSWEEDETLYISTELCELGNFSHFLWEYGRAFPRLDESRVWKIFAELSSVRDVRCFDRLPC